MTSILSRLYSEFTFPIRDPLWNNIYFSSGFKEIISLEPVQKLGRIKQLGPAFHVYPGAVHTRLNHSFGVFHLSRKIMETFLTSRQADFFTDEGVRTFLCAALLHDIGHFPFAHSLKELPLRDHEELSAEIITSSPFADKLKKVLKVNPQSVAAIIDTNIDTGGNSELNFYRKVLSGTLDPDKLDYLNRDAFFCGVPYGIQDTDFIIRKLKVSSDSPALDSSAIMAVENLLFSKYLMYKAVYWHKTVRIATAMIKKAIFMGLEDRVITSGDLYNIDDDEFFRILSKRDYPPFSLIDRVMKRDFYKSVMELSYNPDNSFHRKLTDLHFRNGLSEKIASYLSKGAGFSIPPASVIIDIPEEISFEVDMKISAGNREKLFSDSKSVFTPSVVEGFTGSLRMIRLFIPGELTELTEDYEDFFG